MLNYFADSFTLVKGLLIGSIFGFLLQRSKVTRFNVIINQFLLKDFTMMKVMLSAIVVGSFSLFAAQWFGLIENIFMPHSSIIAVIVGGLFLGVGLAISGYCPGTTFAAIGQGSKDGLFAAIGLFVGAGLYAELHNWFSNSLFKGYVADASSIYGLLGVSPWILIVPLIIFSGLFFFWLDKKKAN